VGARKVIDTLGIKNRTHANVQLMCMG
jgi:hypothetical protein